MKKIILIFIALFLSVSVSKANVFGLLGCGQYLSSCNSGDLTIDCQTQTFYAMGVISALAVESKTELSNFNNQDNIKYALKQFCRNNPLKDTYDGAFNIFYQLQ
jgi:hypothetical protein